MDTKRKTIGEMSNDTRILCNVLESRLVKNGEDLVSYADLSAAIGGRDVRREAKGLLRTARNRVQQDNNVLIEVVAGVGVKLSNAYAGTLMDATKRIVRKARRETRRVVNAMVGKELSNEEKIAVSTNLSVLGAVAMFGKTSSVKQIEAKVIENAAKELPTSDTLRLFTK